MLELYAKSEFSNFTSNVANSGLTNRTITNRLESNVTYFLFRSTIIYIS